MQITHVRLIEKRAGKSDFVTWASQEATMETVELRSDLREMLERDAARESKALMRL
jgi:hypothetical protein